MNSNSHRISIDFDSSSEYHSHQNLIHSRKEDMEDGYSSATSITSDTPLVDQESEFSCRICQEDIFPDKNLDNILSPCRCTGSMSFIHISCFQEAKQNKCELCGLNFFAQQQPFLNPREYRHNQPPVNQLLFSDYLAGILRPQPYPLHQEPSNQQNQEGVEANQEDQPDQEDRADPGENRNENGQRPENIWDRLITQEAMNSHGLSLDYIQTMRILIDNHTSDTYRTHCYYILEALLPEIGFWGGFYRTLYFEYFLVVPNIDFIPLFIISIIISMYSLISLPMSIVNYTNIRFQRARKKLRNLQNTFLSFFHFNNN